MNYIRERLYPRFHYIKDTTRPFRYPWLHHPTPKLASWWVQLHRRSPGSAVRHRHATCPPYLKAHTRGPKVEVLLPVYCKIRRGLSFQEEQYASLNKKKEKWFHDLELSRLLCILLNINFSQCARNSFFCFIKCCKYSMENAERNVTVKESSTVRTLGFTKVFGQTCTFNFSVNIVQKSTGT